MKVQDTVAVVTLDGEIYHNLVRSLKEKGLSFIVRKPGENIPLGVKVVLTTKEEARLVKHHTVLVCSRESVEETVRKALATVRGVPFGVCEEIIVGIDPGKTIGVALIVKGVVVQAESYNNLSEVFQFLRQAVETSKPKRVLLKVGKSGFLSEDFRKKIEEFANSELKTFGMETRVLLVDEKNTTTKARKMKVKRREKDKTSAIEIALR